MIYEKIYEEENLLEAWQRVRSNKPAAGIDRASWQEFEKNLEYNLKVIHKQVQDESYKPQPVVVFKARKSEKGTRIIGLSTMRDKVVQQATLNAIAPYFEKIFLPCSYAYRPKKSALSAVRKAGELINAGYLWLLQTDAKDFFDTMDHGILLELVGKVIDEKPLIRLISKLLKAKIFREMGLFDNIQGSHQGSGLSPLLSNIYLHPMDKILWEKYKSAYLRYSDDITVFVKEKECLGEAQVLIEKCLRELKLSLKAQKTTISHVAGGVVYLGFYMDAKGKGPDKKSVEQLENKLREFDKVRKTDNVAERLKEATSIIRGWYEYYQTLNPIKPPNAISVAALVKLAIDFRQAQFAKRILKQSGEFKCNHPEIAFHIAELNSALGLSNQAVREYAQALQLDPDFEKAKEKIRELQEGESDLYQTVEKMQLVLHHNPNFREGYEKLIECYTKLGLYGFAEKAHQKALELDDDPEADRLPDFQAEAQLPTEKDQFNYKQVDLEGFLDLFKGRSDAHGKQWVDERGRWGFSRVERGLKNKDIYKHLKGEETLAVFLVTARDTVNFIVFDVDTSKRRILDTQDIDLEGFRTKAHQDIIRIKTVCAQRGFSLYIEDSGYKGRHGWLFFDDEAPASKAIQIGRDVMDMAGKPSEGIMWELFPMGKSERHKSLIKLPLGFNRKNNRRCLFLNENGLPINDQALLLKTIKKNKPSLLNAEDGNRAEKQPLNLSPALTKMVEGCKVISHLMKKAEETNYLNHYERILLLYTLTFAGDEGCDLLHKIISYCINYDRDFTQRQIERRKDSPMSCPKIMENFPELAQTLPCDCRFNLPPKGYPSPVIYLIEAEMEQSDIFFDHENENQDDDESGEQREDLPPAVEDQSVPILDFESIFSSETTVASNDDHIMPDSEIADNMHTEPDDETHIEEHNIALDSNTENEEPFDKYANEKFEISKTKKTDVWGLFLEYLSLKKRKHEIDHEIKEITGQLDDFFDESESDTAGTRFGTIRRDKDNNKITWTLTTD